MTAVVDFIGDIVAKTSERVKRTATDVKLKESGVFYQYGHIIEINAILDSYGKTAEFREQKYPAIFLFQDFAERIVSDSRILAEVDLQLLIVASSNQTDRTATRYEKVFKPVLYPIYQCLMKVLNTDSRLLGAYGEMPHTKIDRPNISGFQFRQMGNTGAMFNDFLDAVEINNLNLRILKTC